MDIKPQPRYPFDFIQADALDILRGEAWKRFDLIHASPPCQAFTTLRHLHDTVHPDLIDEVRDLIRRHDVPYIMENVLNSGLRSPVMICGTSLGLRVRRHRLFESNMPLRTIACACNRRLPKLFPQRIGWYKTSLGDLTRYMSVYGHVAPADGVRWAMEMPWATRDECSQAIPPAYTEYLGWQARRLVRTWPQ